MESSQLSFQNLEIEESGDCTSDYVSMHRDVERKKEVGLCSLGASASQVCIWTRSFLGILLGNKKDGAQCSFIPLHHLHHFLCSHDLSFSSIRGGKSFREDRRTIWSESVEGSQWTRGQRESDIEISPVAGTSSLSGIPSGSVWEINRIEMLTGLNTQYKGALCLSILEMNCDIHWKGLFLNNYLKDNCFLLSNATSVCWALDHVMSGLDLNQLDCVALLSPPLWWASPG